MRLPITKEQRVAAKAAGYRAGWLDQRTDRKLDSSWYGVELDPHGTYGYYYSIGYREGWQNAQRNPQAYFAAEGLYVESLESVAL